MHVPDWSCDFVDGVEGIEVANLALSLDDDLLQKVREATRRERTSLDALVREYLTRYVNARKRGLHALDALDALADRIGSAGDGRWARDALHERDAD